MQTPFEITKEEVLNLAAQKLADQYCDQSEIEGRVQRLIEEKISKIVSTSLKDRVDAALTKELEGLMSKEIVPIDIWGEKAGKPTTIRAQLHERAKEFWNVRVNSEGREEHYGGSTRHEQLMKKILQDEFSKSVKENADVIVSAFKEALKADATKLVSEHIDKLINTSRR